VTASALVTVPHDDATAAAPESASQTPADEPCIPSTMPDIALLESIQRRVLWLAVRMVDAANRERDTTDGVKVGGHMASSASLVSAMTALWMAHLDAPDRVAVKPHASPVLHALNYLLGDLDRSYLTRLREFGGLQAYPSRTKDPDRVDFSTGSVGLGPAATLFAAAARRYVDDHFGPRPPARFISLLGDAELDEGNIWEALADPATAGLGNVMWVVDFNRQSLDRVVPGMRIAQWRSQFQAAGWHVVQLKYGRRLRAFFDLPGGQALRTWIDTMPNEHYQSIFGMAPSDLRTRFLDGAPEQVIALVSDLTDADLAELVCDLGGHDLADLLDAFAECDAVTDRPSVVFAYTIKGWGLPLAGNPRNHSMLLTAEQVDALRTQVDLSPAREWDRFDPHSPQGILATERREHLARPSSTQNLTVAVDPDGGFRTGDRPIATQETFGRILVDLSRDPQVAPLLVTTAPDVATSTSLAGFINRTGIYSHVAQPAWHTDPVLRWHEGPTGQHLELGISEMNLFLMLGQLGLAGDMSGQRLLPIGTVYDPFVLRGLDAFIYAVYMGARFVVAGTPSGATLAPEGGAHQSTLTASVGLELPGVTLMEPAYAGALNWLLRDALGRVAADTPPVTADPAETGAYYLRLTTRPIDQSPFAAARARIGDAVLRRAVLAGGYRLVDAWHANPDLPPDSPVVNIVGTGAVLPEVLAAADELRSEGVAAHVVDITSADRLYRAWQRTLRQGVRTATTPSTPGALRACFPDRAPIVSVHDAASHSMAWLGSALGVPAVPLGVDGFGQSGSVPALYAAHDLDPGSIINGALAALSLR
jgi:pyruvate dehydrogenase E1 component